MSIPKTVYVGTRRRPWVGGPIAPVRSVPLVLVHSPRWIEDIRHQWAEVVRIPFVAIPRPLVLQAFSAIDYDATSDVFGVNPDAALDYDPVADLWNVNPDAALDA